MKSSVKSDDNPTLLDLRPLPHQAAEKGQQSIRPPQAWGTAGKVGGSWVFRLRATPAVCCSRRLQKSVGRSSLIGASIPVTCCGLIAAPVLWLHSGLIREDADCEAQPLQHFEILPTVSTKPHKDGGVSGSLANHRFVCYSRNGNPL